MTWDDEVEYVEADLHLPNYGDLRVRLKKHPSERVDGIIQNATMNSQGWLPVERSSRGMNGVPDWVPVTVNLSHFAMVTPVPESTDAGNG